jgi:5'-3' exonuclease
MNTTQPIGNLGPSTETPIMFVDASYLSFYRFFATKRWLQFSHPEIDLKTVVWDQCEPFMKKYEVMYMKSLQKFIRDFNVPLENVVFVKDCPRSDIWRNALYSEYKGTREATNRSFTGGLVFKYTHMTIIPSIQDKFKCKSMRIPKAEADDVIAVCVKHIRAVSPGRKIVVITSDTDYVQLIDEHTEIMTLRQQNMRKKSTGCRELDVFIKVVRGDKSDNIPSCFSRVGDKTATKMYQNRALLEKYFASHPNSRDQFELNQQLIDFNNIPCALCETIRNEYEMLWTAKDNIEKERETVTAAQKI